MAVPGVAAGSVLGAAGQRLPNLAADVRGIALQTVIIMVVLLAIAGGVAAVLLNRGGEAVTDIERQQISRQASEFSGSALCAAAGFVWSSASSSCNATAAVRLLATASHLASATALANMTWEDRLTGHSHTWTPTAESTATSKIRDVTAACTLVVGLSRK